MRQSIAPLPTGGPVQMGDEAAEETDRTRIGERADVEAVAQEVLRTAVDLLEADSGSLYRWDAADGRLQCLASWRVGMDEAASTIPVGQGIVGRAFYGGRSLVVNDYQTWE